MICKETGTGNLSGWKFHLYLLQVKYSYFLPLVKTAENPLRYARTLGLNRVKIQYKTDMDR